MPSLGDAIYCRPFVREFASDIITNWPDLYSDMVFDGVDDNFQIIRPRYNSKNLALGSIVDAVGRFFPRLDNFVFDLPKFKEPKGKYVVVRAPTLRANFYGPSRNPKSEYIRKGVSLIDIPVVGIGNIGDSEWFDGGPPKVDEAYWNGQCSIKELMGLISGAALIIAGPGWTVPASIAHGVPHITVYGGAGKWNAQHKLVDPRMGKVKIQSIEPDNFCFSCKNIMHNCDKNISNFEEKFLNAVDKAMHM